ncbi:Uma2 family endonuclease [Actinoplanes sichuanensis]|uniref:Uma2 family endonuclease n=1 Tax=Actinoplanes sichuanensis TaxID=512349 RepID=A0ABW4AQ00_9ACTN|nr:Uma2 family endonuclease [Actinoplanes sichuanensis]
MSACETPPASFDDHSGPWTEVEFLALDAASHRIELLDGSLQVTPRPNAPHQQISVRLSAGLLPAADAAEFWILTDMNVRLSTGTIMRPDLVVARGPRVVTVVEASDVLLTCEIASPSNTTTDRVLKKQLYAAARIGWYLLIEPEMTRYESAALHLFRPRATGYETYAVAEGDQTLTLDEPFRVAINGNSLLGLQR